MSVCIIDGCDIEITDEGIVIRASANTADHELKIEGCVIRDKRADPVKPALTVLRLGDDGSVQMGPIVTDKRKTVPR